MVRATKAKSARGVRHRTDIPEAAQAAQIAMIVMRLLHVESWQQLVELSVTEDVRRTVYLTAIQQDLIDRFAHILPMLRMSPMVTVAACPVCGRYGLQDRRPVAKACWFTLRCPGSPVKAPATEARDPDAAPRARPGSSPAGPVSG